MRIAGGQTTLDKLALNVGGGSVTVSGTAGQSLNLDADLSRLPASLVNNFAPGLNAAGSISGTVHVTGAAADPNVAYSIDWGGARPRKPGRPVLAHSPSGRTAHSLRKGSLSMSMPATAPA